jgi:hypothetical protein
MARVHSRAFFYALSKKNMLFVLWFVEKCYICQRINHLINYTMTTTIEINNWKEFKPSNVFKVEERQLIGNAIRVVLEGPTTAEALYLMDMLYAVQRGQYNVDLPSLCMDNIKDKELLLDLMHLFVAIKKQVF